jgi:hypothetical protein
MKKGVIDKDGKYIINPQFGNAYADGDKYLINKMINMAGVIKKVPLLIHSLMTRFFGDSKLASIKSS